MTIKTKAALIMIEWLKKNTPYLLEEAVIPPGYHKHKDPEKRALKAKYPVKER